MGARKAQLMLLLGAVALFVGPALDYFTVSGFGAEESITGYKAEESSPYVVAGVVIVIALLVTAVSKSAGVSKGMGVLALLAGAFALFAGIVDFGGDSAGGIEVKAAVGVYVVLAGAALSILGALMLFKSAPAETTTAPPAAPPPAV